MKINTEILKEKVIQAAKLIGNFGIIIISLFLGYILNEMYNQFNTNTSVPQVQKIEKISIAINDRDELMIIDLETGKYLLFSNDVGQSIFNQYASRIYQKNN
jgi:hypothetical protein